MPTKDKEPLVRPPLAPWHRASWPSLEKGAPRKHPVSLERAKNPWLRAAARPGSHGKEQRAPQGPEPPASTATHSPPTRSAQPVLQVCLAPRHQGPAPNSLTGRKDVNRGQGAAGGQRQQVFCLHSLGSESVHITPQGGQCTAQRTLPYSPSKSRPPPVTCWLGFPLPT